MRTVNTKVTDDAISQNIHACSTQRGAVIWLPQKKRGFFAVVKCWCLFLEYINEPAGRCLYMNFKVKARHRHQILLSLHSECSHYTPKWMFQQSTDAISQNIQACHIYNLGSSDTTNIVGQQQSLLPATQLVIDDKFCLLRQSQKTNLTQLQSLS